MENRFENLPETFNHIMLLPDVPDFRTSHRSLTKVHQIIASCCTFSEKEENQRSKGRTVPLDATRRHINAPFGILQAQVFFPCQRILFFTMYGEDIVAFPRNNNLVKPSLMQSFSQCLRDKRRVHG